jgi:hypothetical protein
MGLLNVSINRICTCSFAKQTLNEMVKAMNILLSGKNKINGFAGRTVIALVVLCLMLSLFYGCTAKTNSAGLVINEVVTASSSDSALGSPDWIELYNASSRPIDLSEYKLTDKGNRVFYSFSDETIPAHGYMVVYASGSKAVADSLVSFVDFSLSKEGESLYLIGPQNTVESMVSIPALLTDISFARRDDGTYGYCSNTTPGSENSGAILDAQTFLATLDTGALTISEVLPKSSDGLSWVELMNSGDTNLDLGNYFLSDDLAQPYKWHMPSRTLNAGEYTVVFLSDVDGGDAAMRASFSLSDRDTRVYLYDITGGLTDTMSWDEGIPNDIAVIAKHSYTIYPTRGEINSADTFSSIAAVAMSAVDPVRISEVLPRNEYSIADSDGERFEWVELFNSSGETVSLSSYFLSDDSSDLYKWAFPDVSIRPGEYLVVFLSAKSTTQPELHASFRLSDGETGVYFTNLNGVKVDSLALPEANIDNVSVGRGELGAPIYFANPTPGAGNTGGVSKINLVGKYDSGGVYISEVYAANTAKSGLNDWIELYNGSDEVVSLGGYALSDDADDPCKWVLPAQQIGPNEYIVIEASADPSQQDADTANFGISPTGETLLFCDATGGVIDAFDTGVLSTGMSSGRATGDSSFARVYFDTPTRAQPNPSNYMTGYAAMPVFSESGLYHTQEFSLALSCKTRNAKIYYTLDGSVPSQDSLLYTEAVTISSNTPIRAIAYKEGLVPSEVNSITFLFDAPHNVPVFCIVGDPEQMNHVLTTNRRTNKPEYESSVKYFEADGTLGVSFNCGLRPKGRSSMDNPQNSLSFRLRSAYGQKDIIYPFFDESPIALYSTLSLRNAGQDSRASRIHDPFFQSVAKGLNLDTIETKTVVAYVNGKYCGVYDLNEEQRSGYFLAHYGLDDNEIDVIERDSTLIYGDNEEFLYIRKIAREWDMADDAVFAQFTELVDVDACTDYLIMQIYFGNGDVLNQRFWRAQDYSVKWRPLLFDLDWCMRFNVSSRNVFSRYFSLAPTAGNETITHMEIFCALRKNEAWREKFVERFVQLAVTQFSEERIIAIFDEMTSTMRPEMPQHIDVWGTPRSMNVWENEIAKLRAALQKRQSIVLGQLQRYFKVSDEQLQEYIDKYSTAG